jgi:hypothetical protein
MKMHGLIWFRPDRRPTYFIRRRGSSQEKISCFDSSLEPWAAKFAFFDHGHARKDSYDMGLDNGRNDDALLNSRLRVDPNP